MPHAALTGIDMSWREQGDGDVALFLHGFPFDAGLWEPQLHALPPGWRGVAPDLRGFGESRGHLDLDAYTMEQHARDALALLDHLGAQQAVVCGLSMGGYIALALHRLAPARLRALVLADTRAEPDSDDARRQRLQQAAEIGAQGTAPFVERMLPRLLSPATRHARPELADTVRAMMLRAPAETVVRALRGLAARPDARAQLPQVQVPTLVIGGEADEITPPAALEALAGGIRGAELRILPGAGHVSNLEAEHEFNTSLRAFLLAL